MKIFRLFIALQPMDCCRAASWPGVVPGRSRRDALVKWWHVSAGSADAACPLETKKTIQPSPPGVALGVHAREYPGVALGVQDRE